MPCKEFAFSGPEDWSRIKAVISGRNDPGSTVEPKVRAILDDVAARGDDALVEYTRRFDSPAYAAANLTLPKDAPAQAAAAIPAADLDIIREAVDNIRAFHEPQLPRSWWTTRPGGTILGQMVRAIDRVGLYVPGGQGGETPLISSLIMNAVPALVAGVREMAVVSPPRANGSLNPYILATAHVLGISEIHPVGSAWAIAALAQGTASIPAVDMIAGPGNIFVATAKRLVAGQVRIDMIAGPSEIAVLADASANPDWLAADLLSQAEHDPLASCILITTEPVLAEAVKSALERRLAELPRRDIADRSLNDYGVIVTVPDLAAGCALINLIAPEHLELSVAEPWPLLADIRHAGAIFMGHHSPEPVGDYFAGPNHVLPTLSTARFSSALSVLDFIKQSSVISTPPGFLAEHGHKIARLARLEGLEAHARSVEARGLHRK